MPSLLKPARRFPFGLSGDVGAHQVRQGQVLEEKRQKLFRESVKVKSSSPSPRSLALPCPSRFAPPPWGAVDRSPENWSVCRVHRSRIPPPWPWWKHGLGNVASGMDVSAPMSDVRSRRRGDGVRPICLCIWRRNRRGCRPTCSCLRTAVDDLRPSRCSHALWPAPPPSAGRRGRQLTLRTRRYHSHNRRTCLGVALVHHAGDEVLVLLGLVGAGLGVEADDRQQVFGVGEHLLLDHQAQLLVAGPARVLALVVGTRASTKLTISLRKSLGLAMPAGFSIFPAPR